MRLGDRRRQILENKRCVFDRHNIVCENDLMVLAISPERTPENANFAGQ